LHLHTDCSDGLYAPSEVVRMVREAELAAFALTDHDTLEGYREARKLLRPGDPELIPGLELSVESAGGELHLLAYLFDPEDAALGEALAAFRERRNRRARQIVERLNELGISLSYEQVAATAGKAAVGRPHIAQTMHERGLVTAYQSAFDKYIGGGKPAYVPKQNFTPAEAIRAVHAAGGVVVLAHPQIDETYRHLELLAGLGLDGIEMHHPSHQQRHTEQFRHLAERHRLLVTGGSDFHGREGRYGAIGSQRVPAEYLDALRQRAQARKDTL
ncbi:MAG TPA: PHP domain-containing protein, partial [candidate division Zixibacteria bacterium]|nr:PHP domain-containing protein [candidate division Zixibacteria bacterium]